MAESASQSSTGDCFCCRRRRCRCCCDGVTARCITTTVCFFIAVLLVGALLVHFGVVTLWINSPSSAMDMRNEASTEAECIQMLEERAQKGTNDSNSCDIPGTNLVILRRHDGILHTGIRVNQGPNLDSEVEANTMRRNNDENEIDDAKAGTEEECKQILEKRAQEGINRCYISDTNVVVRTSDGQFISGLLTHQNLDSEVEPTSSDRKLFTMEVIKGGDKVTNRGFLVQQGSQVPDDNIYSRHRRSLNGGLKPTSIQEENKELDTKPECANVADCEPSSWICFWQSSKCVERYCVFAPNWLIIGSVAVGVLLIVVVLIGVIVFFCCRNSAVPIPSSYCAGCR